MPASDFKEIALANARRRDTQRLAHCTTLSRLQELLKLKHQERAPKPDHVDDDCRQRSDRKPTPTHEGARRLQHHHDGELHAGDPGHEKGALRKHQHCC
jgi:hypothetical protein